MEPGKCASNVGRFDGITNTTIGSDCFTGPGKIHNGIAWVVLHEVRIIHNQCFNTISIWTNQYGQYHMVNTYVKNFKVMHALGFYHEHQRPDRDFFVNFDEKYITSNCLNQFESIKMNSNKRKSDG